MQRCCSPHDEGVLAVSSTLLGRQLKSIVSAHKQCCAGIQSVSEPVPWHCWFSDRKGIPPVKKTKCWYVGGGELTGALHVFKVSFVHSSEKSRMAW